MPTRTGERSSGTDVCPRVGALGFAGELKIFGHLIVDRAVEVLGASGFFVVDHESELLKVR